VRQCWGDELFDEAVSTGKLDTKAFATVKAAVELAHGPVVPILEENERIALLHVHAADVALALEQFAHLLGGGVGIQVAHEDGTLRINGLLSAPAVPVPVTLAVPVPLTAALAVTFPVPVPVSIRMPITVTVGTALASLGTAIHLPSCKLRDCKLSFRPRKRLLEKSREKAISWLDEFLVPKTKKWCNQFWGQI
jgi:hypothetical protein